jgi:hypothetical protein
MRLDGSMPREQGPLPLAEQALEEQLAIIIFIKSLRSRMGRGGANRRNHAQVFILGKCPIAISMG